MWTRKNADVMDENKKKQSSSMSKAKMPREIGDFRDAHSLDEFWDETREVEFEVRAERKKRVALEPQIYKKLEAEARLRGAVPETLVNLWPAEKLHG